MEKGEDCEQKSIKNDDKQLNFKVQNKVSIPFDSSASPQPKRIKISEDIEESENELILLPVKSKVHEKLPVTLQKSPGVKGHRISLITNYFLLNFHDVNIYHYDVDITRRHRRRKSNKNTDEMEVVQRIKQDIDDNTSCVKPQQKWTLGKQICREIIAKLCKDYKLESYNFVYDGRKNLYTSKKLPLKKKYKQKFKIGLKDEKRTSNFKVIIKSVEKKSGSNKINLEPLKKICKGRIPQEIPQEIITAFEIIMSHRDPPFHQVQVGRSFFLIDSRKDYLGDGLEIWYGYNQSVHLTQRGPAAIVNFTAKAFYEPGNVIDFTSQILKTDITKHTILSVRQIKHLEEVLAKIKVRTTHQKFPRKYTIKGLTKTSAKETYFEMDKKIEISVAKYFKQNYKSLKFPNLPCLRVYSIKADVFIPMEVSHIHSGQPKLGRTSGQITSNMIRKTSIPPEQRFSKIKDSVGLINKISGEKMNEFGLLLDLQFMHLQGRVISAPKLTYKSPNGKPSIAIPDSRGTWNINGKQFVKSSESISWMLLSFSDQKFCGKNILNRLSDTLCNTAEHLGMTLQEPRKIRIFSNRDSTYSALKYAKAEHVNFVLIVLSPRDLDHSYEEIKFRAEIQLHILTQCIKDEIVVKRFNPQIATNVLLKINSKLGGINHKLYKTPTILTRPTIVFGADVIHSPRGYLCPSIAAVVGSLDAYPAKYIATCRVQQNPDKKKLSQEIIIELKDMVKEILQAFTKNTYGKAPERIIFFRDGVSEGQFNIVIENEIRAIQLACREILNNFIPPITFIIVQKRHQTRIRPKNPEDGIGYQKNIPPGTVVDTDIVYPMFFDFFLCSHEGIQGTSKPARYTVVFDENELSSDQLQKFCYHLCHTYVRCNRSISIPAPVMYADLACTRAKTYVDWYLKTHDESVESNSTRETRQLPEEIVSVIANIKNFESGMFYV